MLGFEPVDKVHGGDQACFGGGAANVQEIWVDVGRWAEGTEDLAVEGYFCRKVCEVEIAYRIVRNSFKGEGIPYFTALRELLQERCTLRKLAPGPYELQVAEINRVMEKQPS